MSWERMKEKKSTATCQCGNGKVVIVRYEDGDDWNRFREGILSESIECSECKKKYHIEHIHKHINCMPWDRDGEVDMVYLVPNDVTLNICTEPVRLPFESFTRFDINAVGRFSKEQLLIALEDMKSSKFSTRLTGGCSKTLVGIYYREHKSRKLGNVIAAVNECIAKYDSYEWTEPRVKEFRRKEHNQIEKNKELLKNNMNQSFELCFDE